jgi:hypothetical protein
VEPGRFIFGSCCECVGRWSVESIELPGKLWYQERKFPKSKFAKARFLLVQSSEMAVDLTL